MEALLDGSFMMNALKLKIDFLDQLEQLGFSAKVPREVLQELKDLRVDAKMPTRMLIDQLFEMLEKRNVKKVGIGAGKIDSKLMEYGKRGTYIATMDSTLRRTVPNRLIISTTDKKVVVERE